MGHAHYISQQTRSTLVARIVEAYRREFLADGVVDMGWVAKQIGSIPQENGTHLDVESMILDVAHDTNGKLLKVEVRNEKGIMLFSEYVQSVAVGFKTKIVSINEGKGIVRKFQITVPTDTV
jgi:hypothetical protein